MQYQNVLWDFDGTLADTAGDVWSSLDYAANRCGGALPADFKINSNLSLPMGQIYAKVCPYPGDDRFERFEALVSYHYRNQNNFSKTAIYPGMEALLHFLKANGVKSYIVTMKPHQALQKLLTQKGWQGYFEETISPDTHISTLNRELSKQEMIAQMVKHTGGNNEDYVYVGDTWTDIEAAKGNQIDCIAVTYGDGNETMLRAKAPAYCVQNVSQLHSLFAQQTTGKKQN